MPRCRRVFSGSLIGAMLFSSSPDIQVLAAPKVGNSDENGNIAPAIEACRSGTFDQFLRLYVESPAVRERFTADPIHVAQARAPTGFVSKMEFLDKFPLATHGWNYVSHAGRAAEKDPSYVLLRTRHASKRDWRVNWVEARFDAGARSGRWIGVPIEIKGTATQWTFTATSEGCWRLTSQTLEPADTPFEPGVQRLQCTVRSDDYRRELGRIARDVRDHPDDMEAGQDLATCAKLHDTIERTISRHPQLAHLRRETDETLVTLSRRLAPAARVALAQDERLFRRSLMRDQYVLADGTTGDWDLIGDLRGRMHARLDDLGRIAPAGKALTGIWSNASGTVEIRRMTDEEYDVEANSVDVDFLAWTCEFNDGMRLEQEALSRTYPNGDTLRLRLGDGMLIVEQGENGSNYCGAGGSLRGAYFPMKPRRTRAVNPEPATLGPDSPGS